MPEGVHWLIWRPVLKGKATLSEIESHYSLNDLMILNQLMDLEDDQESAQ